MLNNRQVPFIGREEELTQIKKEAEEWGTRRALCFHGRGGIGKTRLLQEVYKWFSKSPVLYSSVKKKTITVAIVSEMATTEWAKQCIRGLQSMALELGVTLIETDALHDCNKMESDLADVISQQPDAIIINLGNQADLQKYVKQAIEKGIRVLTLYNILAGIEGISVRVTQDDLGGANVSLEKLAEDINFEGKIAAIWAAGYEPLEKRRTVLDGILQKYPEIKLGVEFGEISDHVVEDTYQKTLSILDQHLDLKAIWATWDEFAKGAVRAIHEKKRQDVSVYSFDFGQASFKEMIQPKSPWMATVATNPSEIGRMMLRLAVQTVLGIEPRGYYTLPMTLITKDSLPKNVKPNSFDWSWVPSLYESDTGWTPELKAMQVERTLGEKPKELIVANILDFDDRSLHFSRNIEGQIAHQLDKSAFERYLRGQQDLLKMEAAGVSPQALQQQAERVRQIFVENFNRISSNKRLVLLFDTAEKLENKEVWNDLSNSIFASKNALFVLTGRPDKKWWTSLQTLLGADTKLIELKPLKEESSQQYLKQKQRLLHVNLEPQLESKLLFLAGGRPILLDLAIEWISRDFPLDWMTTHSLEELQSFSQEKPVKYKEQFEMQLVRKITQIRKPMDQLVLLMSRIYPCNSEMIMKLLKVSENEARSLFDEAYTYVFIKFLPNQQISLHDEMRRLVNEYVWPEVDPRGIRRQRDSRIAAQYFSSKVINLKAKIAQSEKELERDYWLMQVNRINHTLQADWPKGVNIFAEVFEEASRRYQFDLREILLSLVEENLEKAIERGLHNKDTRYQYEIRLVRQKIDRFELEEAGVLLEALQGDYSEPNRQLDVLTRLANINMQSGYLSEAANQLQEALSICEHYPKLRRWIGTVLNTLGIVNRRMGRWKDALETYEEALEHHDVSQGNEEQLASILNNMGYVLSLQGQYDSAIQYCEAALSSREKLGLIQSQGASHSTIGEVYRNWGKYEEAIEHYNRALRIFEPQKDPLWLARLYSYRGAAYRLLHQLTKAANELNASLDYKVRVEQPWAYHVRGCVWWNMGLDKHQTSEKVQYLDRALEDFETSAILAHEVHDIRTHVNNLVGFAEVSYQKWLTLGRQDGDYPKRIQQKGKELENLLAQGHDFPHHFGRMQRVLADLAFDQKRYDEALSEYAKAYALLGERYGGYGRRTFSDELNLLAHKIDVLSQFDSSLAIKWCQQLKKYWSDINNNIARRDDLIRMCNLQKVKARLRLIKKDYSHDSEAV